MLKGQRIGVMVVAACTALLVAIASAGCAADADNHDPLEPMNRVFFGFNQGVDKVIVKPLSHVYRAVFPKPIRDGLRNAYDNISHLDVIANDFLQGKPRRGFGGMLRVGVNSTLGVAGLFDVASELGLEKRDEDFGQTLGVWGAGSGPYIVLPLLGPTTPRDAPGIAMDVVTNPLFYVDAPAATIPIGATDALDRRSRKREPIERRNQAPDPYEVMRNGFLKRREAQIRDQPLPKPNADIDPVGESTSKRPNDEAALQNRR